MKPLKLGLYKVQRFNMNTKSFSIYKIENGILTGYRDKNISYNDGDCFYLLESNPIRGSKITLWFYKILFKGIVGYVVDERIGEYVE